LVSVQLPSGLVKALVFNEISLTSSKPRFFELCCYDCLVRFIVIAPMARNASVPPLYHQRDLRGSDGGSPDSILCVVGMFSGYGDVGCRFKQ